MNLSMIKVFIIISLHLKFAHTQFSMKTKYKNVWTVVEEFGRKYNVRQWVLNYDGKMDSEWIKVWHSISKRSDKFGYFSSVTVSNSNFSNYNYARNSRQNISKHVTNFNISLFFDQCTRAL